MVDPTPTVGATKGVPVGTTVAVGAIVSVGNGDAVAVNGTLVDVGGIGVEASTGIDGATGDGDCFLSREFSP